MGMSKFRFSPELRLLNQSDFRNVFDNTEIKANHPSLLILARMNSSNSPRLGLVIAKKNVKLAVNRNRIKRLIREEFRLHQNFLPPIDLVAIASSSTSRYG